MVRVRPRLLHLPANEHLNDARKPSLSTRGTLNTRIRWKLELERDASYNGSSQETDS